MIRKWWDSLFGRISESDAKRIYLSVNKDINYVLECIKGWYLGEERYVNFERIKSENIHILLPAILLNRIEKFFQYEREFNRLKEKSRIEVYKIFNKYLSEGDYDYLIIILYSNISNNQFNIDNFSEYPTFIGEERFD